MEKDQELLNLNGLGDKKPSELLQHMKNLNADPNTLFKALFLAQLPPDVRRILATSSKTDINELASEADRITEVTRLTQDVQVNATGASRGPPQQSQHGQVLTGPRPMSKIPGLCKYHSTFSNKARKCEPPCKFGNALGNGSPGQQWPKHIITFYTFKTADRENTSSWIPVPR